MNCISGSSILRGVRDQWHISRQRYQGPHKKFEMSPTIMIPEIKGRGSGSLGLERLLPTLNIVKTFNNVMGNKEEVSPLKTKVSEIQGFKAYPTELPRHVLIKLFLNWLLFMYRIVCRYALHKIWMITSFQNFLSFVQKNAMWNVCSIKNHLVSVYLCVEISFDGSTFEA